MSEPTPIDMLREYRRQSHEFDIEQAKLFRSLSPADQRELLFFMSLHAMKAIRHVHGLVDERAATVRSFDDIKTPTQ